MISSVPRSPRWTLAETRERGRSSQAGNIRTALLRKLAAMQQPRELAWTLWHAQYFPWTGLMSCPTICALGW